jgi:hypothetical protein
VNASVLEPHLRTEINRLIGEASAKAAEQEAAERASGKKLFDSPKACLKSWPRGSQDLGTEAKPSDSVFALAGNCFKRISLITGETSYLTARRTWKAFTPVLELLKKETTLTETEAIMLGPELFPYMYGVVTVLRRYEKSRPQILVGVRSQSLAGMNVGMASFPGGLVDPKEPLKLSGPRELFEEGMRGHTRAFTGLAFDAHPDCPSITFSMLAETECREVLPSYEWEGKRMVWADEDSVREALQDTGSNRGLRESFLAQGITVAEDIRFAPDVRTQVNNLLNAYKS